MTSIPGLFAAGDLRVQLTRQITTAVGDATTAAIAVEKFLTDRQERASERRPRSVSELEVVALPNGQFAENCYLVADRRTREAVIIDPGRGAGDVPGRAGYPGAGLSGRSGSPTRTSITSWAWRPVHRATGAPIHLHPLDRPLYDALPQFGAWVGHAGRAAAAAGPSTLAAGQRSGSAGSSSTCGFTPGHSPGSVSFVGHGMVFGGDVLFNGSVGRTDLPGGDSATLMASIQSRVSLAA